MKRTGYLFDQVLAWENLLGAVHKAAKGKQNRPAVADFLFHLEPNLIELQAQLAEGLWRPGPYTVFFLRDPKPRCISAAPFRDRVVHHALMHVLDPYFDRYLIAHSYACRRGKGAHRAVLHAQHMACREPYFLKGDVEHFFETGKHEVAQRAMRRLFKDPQLLAVLDLVIDSGRDATGCKVGLPIGNLTSQYFANHLLGALDHFVKRELKVKGYLRQMDDFLLFARTKPELHRHRAAIRRFLEDRLQLRLKERATYIAPCRMGIPFLGFVVYPATVRVQGQRWRRTRSRLRYLENEVLAGRRNIEELADVARSAFAHLVHGDTLQLRRRFIADRVDID